MSLAESHFPLHTFSDVLNCRYARERFSGSETKSCVRSCSVDLRYWKFTTSGHKNEEPPGICIETFLRHGSKEVAALVSCAEELPLSLRNCEQRIHYEAFWGVIAVLSLEGFQAILPSFLFFLHDEKLSEREFFMLTQFFNGCRKNMENSDKFMGSVCAYVEQVCSSTHDCRVR